MPAAEIPKQYNPHSVEQKWSDFWLRGDFFHARAENGKEPFCIVIPPPNVTGDLHLGHALNNTLQDVLVRWKRMQSFEALWIPGTDHAGIATQVVIEKMLAEQGITRNSLGREKFVQKIWEWKEQKEEYIINQLKKLGCSCDWKRIRFTLDEGLSNAVLEVFVQLHNKGLIYRGEYIINWCPRCLTSLSDDEVEKVETSGSLWYIKYRLKEMNEYLTVATTRPETMLGDTAVAVNPEDERYRKYLGQTAILPLVGRELKIIADSFVDPEFGTGAVKVTPAHDQNDFQVGLRHNLEKVVVIGPDGKMNQNAGKFAGLDRYQARKEILRELTKQNLLQKEEPYQVPIGYCYRCDTAIEPHISEQWFVKMQPLAQPAIEAVTSGKIKFHPEHWAKVYLHWMENIHDWCISRQLWWGHRIPVWYCQDCKEIIVSKTAPVSCHKCKSKRIKQDEDVLDTWFSSWLWPFSTLGWPEVTLDLKTFYPTKALFTASEIIFLWVARMVMAGLEFMGEVPFYDVYIHGTVRDANGIRMSKSLGNGIDPLDIQREYGTDALRSTLLLITPEGQDPCISMTSFELGRNFANKIWNASRLVMHSLKDFSPEPHQTKPVGDLEITDEWILSRLSLTTKGVTEQLSGFRFNTAAKTLYDFIWRDFCDWYLELIKTRLHSPDSKIRLTPQKVSVFVLENILKLLSPFMPFITEEIWHNLFNLSIKDLNRSLSRESWPVSIQESRDELLEQQMEKLQEVITAIRTMRSVNLLPPDKKVQVFLKVTSPDILTFLNEHKNYIQELGRVAKLTIEQKLPSLPQSVGTVLKDVEVYLILEGLIDIQKEKEKLKKEIDKLSLFIKSVEEKLKDKNFLKKAPSSVVEKERTKKEDFEKRIQALKANLEKL